MHCDNFRILVQGSHFEIVVEASCFQLASCVGQGPVPAEKPMEQSRALGGYVGRNEILCEEWMVEDRKARAHLLRSPQKESGTTRLRAGDDANGRQRKRMPLAMPLWLTSLDQPGELDWTVTENVSETGARILTKRRWRVNEAVLISLPPSFSATARVVYCQSLPSGNYVLGVEIEESLEAWAKSLKGAA